MAAEAGAAATGASRTSDDPAGDRSERGQVDRRVRGTTARADRRCRHRHSCRQGPHIVRQGPLVLRGVGRRGRARQRPAGAREVTAQVVADDETGRAAAIAVLRAGGVVALPTDTVYGIAVALDTPNGIERLFRVKRRPPDKSIALLLADPEQAATMGIVTQAAEALAAACWPGGLTLVLARRPGVVLPDVADRRGRNRRRPGPGPSGAASARGRGRPSSDDIGERLGPARGSRCRRDRRAAGRRHRSRPRRRSGARRAGIDGRGRLGRVAERAARRRDPGRPPRRGPRRGAVCRTHSRSASSPTDDNRIAARAQPLRPRASTGQRSTTRPPRAMTSSSTRLTTGQT